jgi:DnaK suppressor protein
MISPVNGVNRACTVTGLDSAQADRVRWRAPLGERWQRKLDEVVALSAACKNAASVDDDRLADPVVVPSLRLHDRATRAFEDLAAIEDAMARIEDGTYGLCAACGRRMPEEWLAEEPQISHCPDCALRLVAWRPSSARPTTKAAQVVQVRPTVPHPAPAHRDPHQPPALHATVDLPLPA